MLNTGTLFDSWLLIYNQAWDIARAHALHEAKHSAEQPNYQDLLALLEEARRQLQEREQQLAQSKADLDAANEKLGLGEAELEEARRQLEERAKEVEELQRQLAEAMAQAKAMQERVEALEVRIGGNGGAKRMCTCRWKAQGLACSKPITVLIAQLHNHALRTCLPAGGACRGQEGAR